MKAWSRPQTKRVAKAIVVRKSLGVKSVPVRFRLPAPKNRYPFWGICFLYVDENGIEPMVRFRGMRGAPPVAGGATRMSGSGQRGTKAFESRGHSLGTATGCRQIGIRPIGVSFFDAVESNRRRKTTFSGRLFCIYSFIREQKYLSANTTPTVSKMLTAATRAERVAAWVYQLRTVLFPMVSMAAVTLCSSPA